MNVGLECVKFRKLWMFYFCMVLWRLNFIGMRKKVIMMLILFGGFVMKDFVFYNVKIGWRYFWVCIVVGKVFYICRFELFWLYLFLKFCFVFFLYFF